MLRCHQCGALIGSYDGAMMKELKEKYAREAKERQVKSGGDKKSEQAKLSLSGENSQKKSVQALAPEPISSGSGQNARAARQGGQRGRQDD